MKYLFIAGLSLALGGLLSAQNTYHRLTSLNKSEGWLRSSSAAMVVEPGSPLLIYQYGGALINLSGDNIGQVSDLRGTGHYDLNRVVRTGDDTIFLAFPVKHTYQLQQTQLVVAPAGSVQNIDTERSATNYNGATGGILFLAASSELSISAPLLAAGAGFRGGAGRQANSDCNRFTAANNETYSLTNWRGAPRGEGVSPLPSGQESGRAPVANGGGGGNDHNSGGGGGANVAAGGGGAGNIVRGLLNNSCRGNFPGRPGRGLLVDDERLYFGGGGGAGHANNTTMASGGHGGGLVVLWSPKITFTGAGAIDVSGISAAEVDGDGGGGGGAGGSILLVADSLTGSPTLDLSGGRGADVDNPSDRCFGPGGGGGGGRLLIAALCQANFSPSVMLPPGGPGQRLNSNECTPDEEPAGSGSAGSRRDLTPSIPFGGFSLSSNLLCGGEELIVTDNSAGADVVSWEILPPNTGVTLQSNNQGLIISLADTVNGNFQLVQSLELNGTTYVGDTKAFNVAPTALADSASIILANETVTASVFAPRGFSSIRYDFGDGTVVDTNATSLQHTYTEGGSYTVSITLQNPACGARQVREATFDIGEFAQPLIVTKSAVGCAPLELTLTEQSTGTFGSIRWDSPGGSPNSSTERSPTITYADTGQFVIALTLLNAVGNDTVATIPVTVRESPTADFTTTIDTATAIFTATSPNATSYRWEFGDGNDSEEMNPVHTYDSTGTYTVVLIASRNTCSVRIEREINIDVLSDVRDLQSLGVKLFPNPTTGRLQLTGPAEIIGAFDLRGRIIKIASTREIDLGQLPSGPYLIRVRVGERVFNVRVLKN